MSVAEILSAPRERQDWGPWRLDPTTCTVHLPHPHWDNEDVYYIPLTHCTTSAHVLDRICQVAAKTWCTDTQLAGLIRALDDILAPQGTLCSFGRSTTLTEAEIRTRVRQAAEQWPN
jgi:hypothetical protein